MFIKYSRSCFSFLFFVYLFLCLDDVKCSAKCSLNCLIKWHLHVNTNCFHCFFSPFFVHSMHRRCRFNFRIHALFIIFDTNSLQFHNFFENSLLFETDGESERRRETRHKKNKVIQADINASVNIMLWFFHKSFLSYATNFGISRRIVKNLNRSVNKLECMFSEEIFLLVTAC